MLDDLNLNEAADLLKQTPKAFKRISDYVMADIENHVQWIDEIFD